MINTALNTANAYLRHEPMHEPMHELKNEPKNGATVAKLRLSAVSVLLIAGCAGVTPPAANGLLQHCPLSPRCVSSEASTPAHQRVTPIPLGALSATQARAALVTVIEAMGGQIEAISGAIPRDRGERYIAASFRSSLLGFVDDLTCRIDPQAGMIHLRSESRIGFYDLGVNRRRVTELRQRLAALLDRSVPPSP